MKDFDGQTGRGLANARTLSAEERLRLVVWRSPWSLHLLGRSALWCPDPLRMGPGGPPYRVLTLDPAEDALFRAFNDARSLEQAAERAGVSAELALKLADRLCDVQVQAIQLHPRRPTGRAGWHLWGPPRPANVRGEHQYDAQGATDLHQWHSEIPTAERHFDDRETTLAHAFARPHAALGGESYGARLARILVERGVLREGLRVAELGPGTGELARDFCAAARGLGAAPGEYLRLDASPRLLAAQAVVCPESRGRCVDAHALDLPVGSVDLLLCNEVVGDLRAEPHRVGQVDTEAASWISRYGLEVLPGHGPYNVGAMRVIRSLAQILAPGGTAFLTEFGAEDETPTETSHLDHPEVSIHFGHLVQVARQEGLRTELLPLAEFLRVDLHARWLARPSWAALKALWANHGRPIEARAWVDPPLPEALSGLRTVAISEAGPAPIFTRFPALILRQGGAS